jgi:hypothetical protein
MKTALQEFIDNVIPMHIIELDMIKQEIKKALEKEKDAIIIAWNDSKISIMNGEQYFEETYNQKNL